MDKRGKRPIYGPSTRLLLTGGGTGGHVIPALELARAHRAHASGSVFYVGSPASLEEELSRRMELPFSPVSSGGFVGKSLWARIRALVKIWRGLGRSLKLLGELRPDLVIGTGGYVQIPVVAAAILRRIPVVLIESNRVMGLANRIFRPLVSRVVTPGTPGDLRGIPVAPDVRESRPLRERFSGPEIRIMVIGGSQGARNLNEKLPAILARAIESLPGRSVEVFHQCGERWQEETRSRYAALGVRAVVEGFVPGLARMFRRQTLVLARAGAMTIAELTASGTPAIYIPFPASAGGHQERNAKGVEGLGAGRVWLEADLGDAGKRGQELTELLGDGERLFGMAVRAWEGTTAVSAENWLKALGEIQNQ